MNVKEYISSGILEAYVLGDLSSHERLEVERNLSLYPELKMELDLIEETQEQFLMRTAIRPNAEIRDRILNEVAGDLDSSSSIRSTTNGWRLAAAASVTIAVVACFVALNYRQRWKSSENRLTELIAQNQRIAQQYNQVNQRIDKMQNDLSVMDNPMFTKVVLTGTNNAPDAMASVYWNQQSSEVFVSLQNMKALSQQNQYQLWAIIEGKPVNAGVFDGNFSGLLKMRDIPKGAIMFAVTIEPRGGKPSPTLETMQVKGDVNNS